MDPSPTVLTTTTVSANCTTLLRAPFKDFKNLPTGLTDLVNYILSFLCTLSDPNFVDKKSTLYILKKLKIEETTPTPESEFLLSVSDAIDFMPKTKQMRKLQDQILNTKVFTFCQDAQQKILKINEYKGSICDLISTQINITPLSSTDHKRDLDNLKSTYLEIKNNLQSSYTNLITRLERRTDACKTLVSSGSKSFALLEAVTDNNSDYLNKIHSEYYERTASISNLKASLNEQKKQIDLACKEFESSFNQLYYLLTNPSHSVTLNTTSFALGSVFGYFNEITEKEPAKKVVTPLTNTCLHQIDITNLTRDDDAHIIRLFELILNKKTLAKKNIQDLPCHNFFKVKTFPINQNQENHFAKHCDELEEIASSKKSLVHQNFLLNQTINFVNLWTPCLNDLRKKEDAELIEQIKKLNLNVTSLHKSICDSITSLEYNRQKTKNEIIQMRDFFITQTDNEIINIHSTHKSLKEKIGTRFTCNSTSIPEKAHLIAKAHDQVRVYEITDYVHSYDTNTHTIEAEMKNFMKILPNIDESKANFKKSYSFIRYCMEIQNPTETDFNIWYMANYYNFFDTDTLTKQID